tara:strand:- start:1414 stop:2646 length:1233 start_codon:yes stop_codon:yes gene_type:complete
MSNKDRKTISINPELFNPGKKRSKKSDGSKTQKIRKNPQPIKHNTLKRELIRRIQQHKQKEKMESKSEKNIQETRKPSGNIHNSQQTSPNNEFKDSMNYLNSLQQNIEYDKKKKSHSRTLKRSAGKKTQLSEHMEMPEMPNQIQYTPSIPVGSTPMAINFSSQFQDDSVNSNSDTGYTPQFSVQPLVQQPLPPYTNLKNSPTAPDGVVSYRQWKTQKNRSDTNTEKRPSIIDDIELQESPLQQVKSNKITEESNTVGGGNLTEREKKLKTVQERNRRRRESYEHKKSPVKELEKHYSRMKKAGGKVKKKYMKKTIKQKYTVGKSSKTKKVSVLVKNLETRKKITDAKNELMKTPLDEIKSYLKKQGFLKSGSVAPPNVLREMYESIMMSGDVTNLNSSIKVHNYLLDDVM